MRSSEEPGWEVGAHRVLDVEAVLPQAADRLNPDPVLRRGETRVRVQRLNLDAASLRQLVEEHGHDGDRVRGAVLDIVRRRGKMQNPVTGSGGMLVGVVDEVHPDSSLGLSPGDRVATLVSLSLTPLRIEDELRDWDGLSEQVPCDGTAILFARSETAVLPEDLPEELCLSVLDVCGAPAQTDRVVRRLRDEGVTPRVLVLGGAGKAGVLSLAAARMAGAETIGLVLSEEDATELRETGKADHVLVGDARDPLRTAEQVKPFGPVDLTVVCVDAPGCEHSAVLATTATGTVIFFSMATSFAAAALGAEGLASQVEMIIGNGFVPGHAVLALEIVRTEPAVRAFLEAHRPVPVKIDERVGVSVSHRRYVGDDEGHYEGGLVSGGTLMQSFSDLATELCIRTDGCEGLFAGYSRVTFHEPVRAGDVVESRARVAAVGSRSRRMHFTVEVLARRSGRGPGEADVMDEPLLVTSATGTVVIPAEREGRWV